MRKLGICTAGTPAAKLDDFYRLIKEIGFEATFTDYKDGSDIDAQNKLAQKHGILIDSTHAPFSGINAIWQEGEEGEGMLQRLLDCIDSCAAYDIPKMVVHLSSGKQPPRINDLGYSRFDRMIQHAIQKKVQVAFENQRVLANLAFMMEVYQDVPEVGFCWDTGHEACFAGGRDYMALFGDRLSVLHLHDNHAEPDGDEHLIPFDGTLNFKRVAQKIKDSGYEGPLTLECFRKKEIQPLYKNFTDEQYFRRAYAAVFRLREMIEK